MKSWKSVLVSQDIDAMLTHYSEDFISEEAEGKMGVRHFWEQVREAGMMKTLNINLETAQLEITGDTAEFLILDDTGDRMMAFIVEKVKSETGETWLITGTPPEIHSYDKYATPHGDDCVQHGGFFRCWDIKVPQGLKGSVPLVIDLHGLEIKPSDQRSLSGFDTLAASEKFIVACPYGVGESWNSGEKCCAPASEDEIDDIGFIRKLVKKIPGNTILIRIESILPGYQMVVLWHNV